MVQKVSNRMLLDVKTVSVTDKAFGATGDGTTDDLSAIQAAVNSGAKRVEFPAGTFMVSARIKPVSGQQWVGVKGKTTIKLLSSAASNANTVLLNADGLEGSLDDWSAEGIIFDGNHKDAAFVVYGCNNLRMTDCDFVNGGTYGLALQARPGFTIALPQDRVHLLRCGFNNNGSDSTWDGLDIKWCTNSSIIACTANGNTDVGINVRGRNVDIVAPSASGNGTAGILLQSNDSTEDSYIRLVGGQATGTTAGPGLEIQGNNSRNTYIEVEGFQSYSNTGDGLRISGSGKVIGSIDGLQSRSNTADGVNIACDLVTNLTFSNGIITANGGDGFDNTGKNCMLNGMKILANTGTGYKENVGADNNYVLPSCVINGNGTDISARVGVESDDGFMSVRLKTSIRLFPGLISGLEMQTDAGGTFSSMVAVGDAASIDLRLVTKGNGDIGLYKDNGTRQIGLFREAGTATVNYPDFVASLTGTPVLFQASGTDANIDLQLNPKGTGLVRFGTLTASGDSAINGYVTAKTASGTTVKLATIP